MNTTLRSVVVVGVDGSPESVVAARWAAREAESRHQRLLLIHAYRTHGRLPARSGVPDRFGRRDEPGQPASAPCNSRGGSVGAA
jgi:nucleotide-binding universal stress UspA family protein